MTSVWPRHSIAGGIRGGRCDAVPLVSIMLMLMRIVLFLRPIPHHTRNGKDNKKAPNTTFYVRNSNANYCTETNPGLLQPPLLPLTPSHLTRVEKKRAPRVLLKHDHKNTSTTDDAFSLSEDLSPMRKTPSCISKLTRFSQRHPSEHLYVFHHSKQMLSLIHI